MQNIEDIKKAARTKLVGYTEREIECFIEGAKHMVGHLPQRRSDAWYQEQAARKEYARIHAQENLEFWKKQTGLGQAVERLKNSHSFEDVVDYTFTVFFENLLDNAAFRAEILSKIGAEDQSAIDEILQAVQTGIKGFNETHQTQLNFQREEMNDNRWTFSWDEPI